MLNTVITFAMSVLFSTLCAFFTLCALHGFCLSMGCVWFGSIRIEVMKQVSKNKHSLCFARAQQMLVVSALMLLRMDWQWKGNHIVDHSSTGVIRVYYVVQTYRLLMRRILSKVHAGTCRQLHHVCISQSRTGHIIINILLNRSMAQLMRTSWKYGLQIILLIKCLPLGYFHINLKMNNAIGREILQLQCNPTIV